MSFVPPACSLFSFREDPAPYSALQKAAQVWVRPDAAEVEASSIDQSGRTSADPPIDARGPGLASYWWKAPGLRHDRERCAIRCGHGEEGVPITCQGEAQARRLIIAPLVGQWLLSAQGLRWALQTDTATEGTCKQQITNPDRDSHRISISRAN